MNNNIKKYIMLSGISNLSYKASNLIEERLRKHNKSDELKGQEKIYSGSEPTYQCLPHHRISNENSQGSYTNNQLLKAIDRKDFIPDSLILSDKVQNSSSCNDIRNTVVSNESRFDSWSVNKSHISEENIAPSDENVQWLKFTTVSSNKSNSTFDQYKAFLNLEDFSAQNSKNTSNIVLQPQSFVPLKSTSSLRERLRLIREKHRSIKSLDAIMDDAETLLSKPTPLNENDDTISVVIDGLKKIQSSLSEFSLDIDHDRFSSSELRNSIKSNSSPCVKILTRIFAFALNCGFPSHKDGISIPLLSLSISSLVALFADSCISLLVSQNALTFVIKNAIMGLLDPRLALTTKKENSSLSEDICKKLLKSINKLAIQAAYGASRHLSLQALMFLQFQLCGRKLYSDPSSINMRMSKIITKLFVKTLKSEESEQFPFSSKRLDIKILLVKLEDMLLDTSLKTSEMSVDCDFENRMKPCINMGRDLMMGLLKAKHRDGNCRGIIMILDNKKLSRASRLYISCCNEIGIFPDMDREL